VCVLVWVCWFTLFQFRGGGGGFGNKKTQVSSVPDCMGNSGRLIVTKIIAVQIQFGQRTT
jgi:hypothetical protein